jgi:DNA uptake protein ComE-like DNA-binding protein
MTGKDFFYFSRRERQGILLLLVFTAGIFAGKWLFAPPAPQPLAALERSATVDEQTVPLPPTDDRPAYTPLYTHREKPTRRPSFSLPENQRTYYQQEPEPEVRPEPTRHTPLVEKFTHDTVVELNSADTLMLMRIPGIGRGYAKRITGYRRALGGFHRLEQLQEVHDMYKELYEQIIPYLSVDPALITPISMNRSSLDKLRAHPYIRFFKAKAIIEIRKKKGVVAGIEELQLLEEFEPEDWVRLTPYLDFQNGKSEKLPESAAGGGGSSEKE